MSVQPVPSGYRTVIPYLAVDGADRAIAYYTEAFGARERMRMPRPGGKVGHAELALGDSVVMLADPWPEGTADMGAQCYDIFRDVVREIAAVARLRTGTADSAAQALWMSCHGVVALYASRPNFGWAAPDELIQVTLDGLLNGLVTD